MIKFLQSIPRWVFCAVVPLLMVLAIWLNAKNTIPPPAPLPPFHLVVITIDGRAFPVPVFGTNISASVW